jgi:hypothetical protein
MTYRHGTICLAGALGWLFAVPAQDTPGGLNGDGCHVDRKDGTGYHGHRGSPSARHATSRPLGLLAGSAYYANCSAARAARAAPVRAGQPGYSRKLDRDGDGVGCE